MRDGGCRVSQRKEGGHNATRSRVSQRKEGGHNAMRCSSLCYVCVVCKRIDQENITLLCTLLLVVDDLYFSGSRSSSSVVLCVRESISF